VDFCIVVGFANRWCEQRPDRMKSEAERITCRASRRRCPRAR
jgi:hypothetical protein